VLVLGGRARPWPRPRPPGARGAERLRMGGEEKEEDGAGPMKGRQHARPVGMMNGADVVDLEIFSKFLGSFLVVS
jgi:hypothetical protein